MFLSFYASFRWAKRANKDYFLKISAFIGVVSFVSAFIGTGIGSFLFGPLPVLSFPLYGVWDETMGPPLPPEGYGYWMGTYKIHFLATPIYSISPISYGAYSVTFLTMEVGAINSSFIPPNSLYSLMVPFMLFILVNLLAALLGLGLRKLFRSKETTWERIRFIVSFIVGIAIIAAGRFLFNVNVTETVRNPPWGGNYVSVTLYPYQMDAFVFVVFGITWLAIAIIEIIVNRSTQH